MAELNLVVVSGSLRRESHNTTVADQLVAAAPQGVTARRFDLRPVPLFDQDLEDAGEPSAVLDLKNAVREAHGLVVVTPEYNYGVPAVAKNAVDWLSRPWGNGPIKGTAVGVVSASPSRRGGIGAREHLSDTLRVLTERFYEETLGLAEIPTLLDEQALNEAGRAVVLPWLEAFCSFAAEETG